MLADAARSATGDPAPRSAERGANPKAGAPADNPAYDYVTVGHVTVDLLLDPPGPAPAAGLRQPGGGAFYSALQAARLGLRALILTQGVPRELEELLEPYRAELEVRIVPAPQTTTLRTAGRGPARRQRLLAWAGPIAAPRVPDTAILHLAPVARETPRAWSGRADFVGLTPQGLLRAWDARGDIAPTPLEQQLLPQRYDAAVLSSAELQGSAGLDSVLAVTAGSRPTTVHVRGRGPVRVPALTVEGPRDDLGAGDVFAAAFFVALHEGLPPATAAALGNAAAAVRIAGVGPDAIGDRAAIDMRL